MRYFESEYPTNMEMLEFCGDDRDLIEELYRMSLEHQIGFKNQRETKTILSIEERGKKQREVIAKRALERKKGVSL